MSQFLEFFKDKKNLFNLILLLVLVVGIPIGIGLVRQQQILRSRAAIDPIVFLAGKCVEERNGKLVATCNYDIAIQLTSPLGPPQASDSAKLDPCPEDNNGKKNKKDKKLDDDASIVSVVFAQEDDDDSQKQEKEKDKTKDKKKDKNKKDKSKDDPCPEEEPSPLPIDSPNPIACDPEEKDEEVVKATWIRGEPKECKKNVQEVEYSCTAEDKKGKQKTQKKKLKESCTGASLNNSSDGLVEKLLALIPVELNFSGVEEVYGGHVPDNASYCKANNNCCSLAEEGVTCNTYCSGSQICTDLDNGEHECKDGEWKFLRNECTSCGKARKVEQKECSGETRVIQENVDDSACNTTSWCGSGAGSGSKDEKCKVINSSFVYCTREQSDKGLPSSDPTLKNNKCYQKIYKYGDNLDPANNDFCCTTPEIEVEISKCAGGCSIGFQEPSLTDSQVSCMSGSKYGNLVGSIKGNDPKFANCNNKQVLNYWCNGGVSDDAKNRDCPQKKQECASTGSGGSGSGKGSGGAGGNGGGGGKKKDKNKSPSPTPIAQSNTVSFKLAENPTDLASVSPTAYDIEPKIINYTFKSSNPGVKSIFVEFLDKDGRKDQRTASIELVAPSPVIATAKCSLSSFGTGVNIDLSGEKFGSEKGSVSITDIGGDILGEILSWEDNAVSSTFDMPEDSSVEGTDLVFILTRKDGVFLEGNCSLGETTSLALGAKLFCRAPRNQAQEDVELNILEDTSGSEVQEEIVSIDKNGLIEDLETRFVLDKNYQVSIKAPKSLRRNSKPFVAKEGTIQLLFERNDESGINNNFLPVGDIFPQDSGDGTINTSDALELFKQWGKPSRGTTATLRPGDFNQDGKVNSIDWACMRYDFNEREDQKLEPVSVQPIRQ